MASAEMVLTVGQAAEQFGVTVRTLHHYDEIGLLSPSDRSVSGYRLYSRADLERLSIIVVYRRLDLSLDQIRAALAEPSKRRNHLQNQRAAVMTRLGRLHKLVAAIDNALEKDMNNQKMTTQDMQDLFGDGFSDEYRAEAEQRWGDSEPWIQSTERTASYTRADWEAIKAETDANNAAFVAAMTSGSPATSEAAMAAAEQHRQLIHDRFYDIDHDFHRGLGDMYVADPRFTKTYEDIAPGLAQYMRDAIHANADRR